MHPPDETAPRHRRSGPPRDRHHVRHRHGDGRGVRRAAALLAGAVVLGAFLTGAVPAPLGPRPEAEVGLVGGPSRPGPSGDPRGRRGAGESSAVGPVDAVPARGPVVRAAGVLRAWDQRRAEAWAEGDVAALRELYVDRAGAADVRLLRRYTDRGLRVEGLTTQLLAVDVLEHAPGRWRLRVTDRVAGGVVVGARERLRLPRDGADTHVVTLVRADGAWRVAEVRPVPA